MAPDRPMHYTKTHTYNTYRRYKFSHDSMPVRAPVAVAYFPGRFRGQNGKKHDTAEAIRWMKFSGEHRPMRRRRGYIDQLNTIFIHSLFTFVVFSNSFLPHSGVLYQGFFCSQWRYPSSRYFRSVVIFTFRPCFLSLQVTF